MELENEIVNIKNELQRRYELINKLYKKILELKIQLATKDIELFNLFKREQQYFNQ